MSRVKESQVVERRVDDLLSHVNSSSSTSLFVYKTVRDLLDEAAESTPDRVLYHFPAESLSLTARDLHVRSRRLAQNLLHMGFKKGERLAVALDSTYHSLVTFFAASTIGLVVVFVNSGFRKFELEHLLRKVYAKGLLVYDQLGANDFIEILTDICPEIREAGDRTTGINSATLPDLKHLIVIQQTDRSLNNEAWWRYEDLADRRLVDFDYQLPYIDSDDVFSIVNTSGTTGFPKGVYHTQMSYLNTTKYMLDYMTEIKPNKTYCNCFPFLSVGSPLVSMMVFFTHCQIVFPYRSFSLPLLAQAIQRFECTGIFTPPRALEELIKFEARNEYSFSSIESIVCGAYDSKKELLEKCCRLLFPNLKTYINLYGSSECLVTFGNRIFMDKLSEETDETISTLNSFAPLEYKLVDMETGEIKRLGEDGVLYIRSFSNMIGYWNDPDKTREVMNDLHWINTGDCFRMNSQGRITTRGRVKFVIKIFHFTVYPAEIEAYLAKHPSVDESCVFGIPSETSPGDQICAYIKLKRDSETITSVDEIQAFCRANFADFKVPSLIKFVTSFPLTPLGKIERATLMSQAKQELNKNKLNN